ncbi:NAC domain-containing protein 17 [Nymphaea thermarum]|nr:NAC domain-containing protein 17 [Nymphaea thermarum]
MRRHEIPDLHRPRVPISIPQSMEEVKFLPTGFRFHPTEEELVCHYLRNKVSTSKSSCSRSGLELIREVDVYRFDPADLPAEAGLATGKDQWFFFSARGRRDGRRSRATDSGVWKIEGRDEPVVSAKEGVVGMKRTLAFYRGKPLFSEKTEWMMNEYVLVGGGDHSATNRDSFAIYRMFLNPHFGRQRPESDGQPCDKYEVAEQDDGTAISSIAEINVQEDTVSEGDELEKILMEMLDEEEELEGLVVHPPDVSLHHEMSDEGFSTLHCSSDNDCLSDEELLRALLEGDFIELNDLVPPLSEPTAT